MTLLRSLVILAVLAWVGLLVPAPQVLAQQRIIFEDQAEYEYARHIHSGTRLRVANTGDWIVETWFRNGNDEVKGAILVETRLLAADGRCLFATAQSVEIERTTNAFSIDQSLVKQGKIPRRLARFAARAEFRAQLFPAGRSGRVEGVPPQNVVLGREKCDLGTGNRPKPTPAPPNVTQHNRDGITSALVPTITYLVLP